MKNHKTDISTREDVTRLVTSFYEKVKEDKLLAPVFNHVDWEHHTPIIIGFWCMILLGEQGYKRNPFEKHIRLPIQSEHFTQWLLLFGQTVDENFSGEKATEAKERSQSIATMFQLKLGLLDVNR